jgi:DNA-binding transcriptional regulator YdaS (Cro superfamily)
MVMKHEDGLDSSHLEALIREWGMEKLEIVSHYARTAIYQWRPSRVPVPPEAALRINELAEHIGFTVERLRPDLPWHLLYRGRDRRAMSAKLVDDPSDLEKVIKDIGVTDVANAAGRSRQNIYDAMKSERCPVWLALAIEQASGHRYLVEDLRPELPWYPLYSRREKVYP